MFDLIAQVPQLGSLKEVRAVNVQQGRRNPTIEVELQPTGYFAQAGFPTETIRIEARQGRDVSVYPADDSSRSWRHRYRDGSLCMWHPHDYRALRWLPQDGLVGLIRVASRHLIYEEIARRTGEWPVEESAHSKGARNRYLPGAVRTREMRLALKRLRR